jgi:ABC-type multidrug transport system fused ATPase/permease subunit
MQNLINLVEILSQKERRAGVYIFCIMLISSFIEMISIGMILPIVAVINQYDSASKHPYLSDLLRFFGYPNHHDLVVYLMIIMLIVYCIKNLFLAFCIKKQTAFAYRIQADLSKRLFEKYILKPFEFHLLRNSAELIQIASAEVNFFCSHALIPLMLILSETLVLLSLAALLFTLAPSETIIILIILGLCAVLLGWLSRRKLSMWGESRRLNEEARLQIMQQAFEGIKDVKLSAIERKIIEKYSASNLLLAKASQSYTLMQQYPRLLFEFLIVNIFCLFVISKSIFSESPSDLMPILSLFALAAYRILPSINRLLAANQSIKFMEPTISKLSSELLIQSSETKDSKVSLRSMPFESNISLNNVTFFYAKSSRPALENVFLKIRKGTMVGIIGRSGSGKSTIVDLVLGLLNPKQGEIQVDGNNILENLKNWQKKVCYVPQNIYLIDDTIIKNIALGLDDTEIDHLAMTRAIKGAHLSNFIERLPQGLNTIVGERGSRLSGGERQRIGIARALYRQSEILILDEATSALDINTEKAIMSSVNLLKGNKTILIITHRLATLSGCDEIHHMENGKIKFSGTLKDATAKFYKD